MTTCNNCPFCDIDMTSDGFSRGTCENEDSPKHLERVDRDGVDGCEQGWEEVDQVEEEDE